MLVSSNLRFPHNSHIKTQAPFPCSRSCHAEQTQGRLQLLRKNKKERKKQHEASSQGARLNWLHQLTIYLGSTLLWTRLCLLGGAICTRAGEKERDIENMETNVRGKIHGGKKEWIIIKLNRANTVWISQVTALRIVTNSTGNDIYWRFFFLKKRQHNKNMFKQNNTWIVYKIYHLTTVKMTTESCNNCIRKHCVSFCSVCLWRWDITDEQHRVSQPNKIILLLWT